MRNGWIYRLAAAMLSLCLLTGCTEQVTPPTLTPSFERAWVTVNVSSLLPDGTVTEDTGYVCDDEDPTADRLTDSVTDHSGDEVTFTLDSSDPNTMSMVVGFDRPLVSDGKTVTDVTVSRDQSVVLYAEGDNGAKDTFTLTFDMYYTRPASAFISHDSDIDMTMCYGEGVLLTMYPNVLGEANVFAMTMSDDPLRVARGTYTVTDDTLTLYEDAGLSILTFRRNDRHKAWQYDADASARHALSLAPVVADSMRLAFGFSYELNQDVNYAYDYRVTDFDGQTILAEKENENKPRITPLSPSVLRIRTYGSDTQTCYLNTQTGECSASYHDVIADSPAGVVYTSNGQLVVEELGGDYTRHTYDAAAMGGFKSVSSAILDGDTLTMLYRDAEDKLCAGSWNWKTGERLASCPLMIVGLDECEDEDARVPDESGTGFLGSTAVSWQCEFPDGATLYYSGVSTAAILLDGEYADLVWPEKEYLSLRFEDKYDEAEALKSRAMTAAGLQARLQADVSAGLATAQTCFDGKATVYRYKDMSRYHAVTLADTDDGRCVYIGDADAALAHLAGELTSAAPLIKFNTTEK